MSIDEQLMAIKGSQYEPDCDPYKREEIALKMVRLLRKEYPTELSDIKPKFRLLVDGYIPLGRLLDQTQVNEIHSYLEDKDVCTSHVVYPGAEFHPQDRAQFNCFKLEDILGCPHLLELALRKDILQIVNGYLGCIPTLYSMNTWWSRAGYRKAGPQDFHRDMDDFRFLSLFIYLTDVDYEAGPHVFIRGTHGIKELERLVGTEVALSMFPPAAKNGYGYNNLYDTHLNDYKETLVGNAGEAYLIDTYGIHKGEPLVSKDRLVIWLRYGLHKNPPTDVQIPNPVPFDKSSKDIEWNDRNNFITRLLIQ